MKENAYMTHATWDEMVEWLIANLRGLEVVKDHPLWWLVLFLDGYHAHVMTKKSKAALLAARIIVLN